MSSEGRPAREVAYRVFAAEYEDAAFSYKESDEERAPNYVVTPTGARVNRLFVVGVLTELERVGDDDVLRARVVDPTGAFVVYAGQYQPEALAVLEDTDTPSFVAVTGKANTFTPDGSDRTFSSIRPESVTQVDADTRDRWVVSTAEHTIDRIAIMADAIGREERGDQLQTLLQSNGVPPHLAAGIPRALNAYDTREAYLGGLRELAVDAARQVAGELDEVPRFDVEPDDPSGTEVTLQAGVGRFPGVTSEHSGGEEVPDGTATDASSEPAVAEAESVSQTDTQTQEAAHEPEARGPESTGSDDTGTTPAESESQTPEDDEPVASTGESRSSEAPMEEEFYELDEEEREAVESEYGVEFTSGTEIPEAGETEIDTPNGENDATEDGAAPESEPDTAPAEDSSSESADLEDVVVDRMQELGGGDGVQRRALIDDVVTSEDVDEDAVAEAIQSALMSGRCYESGEDELTPI